MFEHTGQFHVGGGLVVPRDHIAPVILSKTKGLCYYCGSILERGWHIDHVHPRCRGGTDALSNLVPSCPTCNCSKGTRTIEEWRKSKTLSVFRESRSMPYFSPKQVAYLKGAGIDLYSGAKQHIFWFERANNDNERRSAAA